MAEQQRIATGVVCPKCKATTVLLTAVVNGIAYMDCPACKHAWHARKV